MQVHHAGPKTIEIIVLPVISSALTLFLGLLVSELQDRVGLFTLLLALFVFLVTYGLTLVIVTLQWRPISVGLFEKIDERLSNLIDRNAIGIIDNGELIRQEISRKYPEIWLITDDLAEDVPGGPFYDVVDRNLKKGSHYIYFCPRTARNEGRAKSIREGHSATNGRLMITFLSEDFFFLTPKLDFTIFDPFNRTEKRVGYMGLPIESDQRLYCAMDYDLLDSLVGKLSGIISKGEQE